MTARALVWLAPGEVGEVGVLAQMIWVPALLVTWSSKMAVVATATLAPGRDSVRVRVTALGEHGEVGERALVPLAVHREQHDHAQTANLVATKCAQTAALGIVVLRLIQPGVFASDRARAHLEQTTGAVHALQRIKAGSFVFRVVSGVRIAQQQMCADRCCAATF